MATATKSVIVFGTTPIYGHTMPLRAIAKHLIGKGYEVIFMTGSHFGEQVRAIGAKFVPLMGKANFSETKWPKIPVPPPPPGIAFSEYIMRYIFADMLEEQFHTLQSVLSDIRSTQPNREVVVLYDQSWYGALPGLMGAPGLKPTAVIGIGIIPMMLSGEDVPPYGLEMTPDDKPETRENFRALTKQTQENEFAESHKTFVDHAKNLGVTDFKDGQHLNDLQYLLPDRFLQMCVPTIEYPRKHLPDHVGFSGGLPKGQRDRWTLEPDWWSEISRKEAKKDIIAVSQGTLLVNDFGHLIIPTLEALKDLPNIIVVAALGRKGATLPSGTPVPANARICDFIPFDELFPHCSVFVTNGGYGGLQHALSHGLPMVIAGTQSDKPENAVRAEWAGVGVNLWTETPTSEAVRSAVQKILSDPEYRRKAKKIEAEMEAADPLGSVVKAIEEVTAKARST
jgi:UDP:flavonoid glycosyltransferase YjiC (YdhE family)